jgi:phospholipid/cholesterol/gamma-HCH transport system permease protein
MSKTANPIQPGQLSFPWSFFHGLGAMTLERSRQYIQMAAIFVRTFEASLTLKFLNHATLKVLVRQLYFTAVQALPAVLFSALVLGAVAASTISGLLTTFGAQERLGEYLSVVIMEELAPLTVCIILLLRSGLAVISEIGLMKLNHELDTLRMLGIDEELYLYLPRILAFIFSGPALAICSSVTGFLGGYLVLGYVEGMAFDSYAGQLIYALKVESMFVVVAKPMAMTTGIVLLSLAQGLVTHTSFTEVPIRLIRGVMNIVLYLILVELVFLWLV